MFNRIILLTVGPGRPSSELQQGFYDVEMIRGRTSAHPERRTPVFVRTEHHQVGHRLEPQTRLQGSHFDAQAGQEPCGGGICVTVTEQDVTPDVHDRPATVPVIFAVSYSSEYVY